MAQSQKHLSCFAAELCRELSGWPRRAERSTNRKRCRNFRSNLQTWANTAWGPQDGNMTASVDGDTPPRDPNQGRRH